MFEKMNVVVTAGGYTQQFIQKVSDALYYEYKQGTLNRTQDMVAFVNISRYLVLKD
jgi:hypothetical protein